MTQYFYTGDAMFILLRLLIFIIVLIKKMENKMSKDERMIFATEKQIKEGQRIFEIVQGEVIKNFPLEEVADALLIITNTMSSTVNNEFEKKGGSVKIVYLDSVKIVYLDSADVNKEK